MAESAQGSRDEARRETGGLLPLPSEARFPANDNEGPLAIAFLRYRLWLMALVGGLGAGAVALIGLGGG